MHIGMIAIGTRMPAWVEAGMQEYVKRLPREWRFQIREIPLQRRQKHTAPDKLIAAEGEKMLACLPPRTQPVALDSRGEPWSTEELAGRLEGWLQKGHDLAFLIGGPEGLAPACLERAGICWSLSRLTFPHPLVRILVVEQLYRAWSLLQGHPYHR